MQDECNGEIEYEDHLPISRLETDRMNLLALHQHKTVGIVKVSIVEFEHYFHYQSLKRNPEAMRLGKQMLKYYTKRHFFFSRYDEGIELDRESWYSVVAEPISKYLLGRIQETGFKKVFEPFCGVGGIAVHLSPYFQEYVVNDIDKSKIEMLENNLDVYGVPLQRLKYLNLDFFLVEPFPCDLIILCPPWGGINLDKYSTEPLDQIMSPKLSHILLHAIKFSSNMILQLPKNTNLENLFNIIIQTLGVTSISIDNVILNGKSSQLYIYIGAASLTKMNNGGVCQVLYDAFEADTKEEKAIIKNQYKANNKKVLSKIYNKFFKS